MKTDNPIDHVIFYKNNKIVKNSNMGILPHKFEEVFYRIYSKDPKINSIVCKFFQVKND